MVVSRDKSRFKIVEPWLISTNMLPTIKETLSALTTTLGENAILKNMVYRGEAFKLVDN